MSAWEAMPVLDLAIKEVLRLTISGTTLRRVLRPGVVIDGYEIPVGSFLCHPVGTDSTLTARLFGRVRDHLTSSPSAGITHLDEKIYKEPHTFDPDRFLPPRSEEDSEVFSFLGWGVGTAP
jgi:sterol 14-demethylase